MAARRPILYARCAVSWDPLGRRNALIQTAVIAGAGPGLGAALARRFAAQGCAVALVARSPDYVGQLAGQLRRDGTRALALSADITEPDAVGAAFARVRAELGPVDLLVNHASGGVWKGLLDLAPDELERAWRVSVMGAFLCSRAAVPDMLARGGGAVLFTGATSSIRGRAGAVDFSSAKFGVRGLADAMARELWPRGIHVAHVIVDGVIDTPALRARGAPVDGEPLLDPDDMARVYWDLAQQRPGAWSFEVDVRAQREAFFE